MKFWKTLANEVLDVLLPGNCPVCGGPPKKDEGFYACKGCLDRVAWIGTNACKYCGIPMHAFEYQGLTCSSCRKQDFHFKAGKCLFFLDEAGKSIIHEIKYHGSHEVLSDFHHWMERSPGFEEFLDEAHLIPVPLHKSRQSSRGFNQSLWIAQAIKKYMGSSVEIGDFMKRTRNTPTQTRLEKKARKKNVKNAFALKPGVCLDSLHRIILIDDVFTTGATLDACAQVWVEAGISQVEVAALGHG